MIGPGVHTFESEIKTTPDGTVYLPPLGNPDEQTPGSGNPDETGPGIILAMLFVLIFGVVMIGMISGSGIASEACWFILVLLGVVVVSVLKILTYKPPASIHETPMREYPPEREVRIETIHEIVKVRCRYCGTLNLVTDTKCQSCGGTL